MDVQRIERALRAGPVDEPTYVPGSHGGGRRRSARFLTIAGLVGAVVVGVVLGVGLSTLQRAPVPVGGVDQGRLALELPGRWVSDEISRDRWVSALVESGNDIDDIDNFLTHFDPIVATTHYELEFSSDRLAIADFADDQPRDDVASGPYQIDADGTLHYDDQGCFVTARFRIDGDHLMFDRIATDSCGADERIANTAFFNLVSYTRATP
jgi:hypothetical protein